MLSFTGYWHVKHLCCFHSLTQRTTSTVFVPCRKLLIDGTLIDDAKEGGVWWTFLVHLWFASLGWYSEEVTNSAFFCVENRERLQFSVLHCSNGLLSLHSCQVKDFFDFFHISSMNLPCSWLWLEWKLKISHWCPCLWKKGYAA